VRTAGPAGPARPAGRARPRVGALTRRWRVCRSQPAAAGGRWER